MLPRRWLQHNPRSEARRVRNNDEFCYFSKMMNFVSNMMNFGRVTVDYCAAYLRAQENFSESLCA